MKLSTRSKLARAGVVLGVAVCAPLGVQVAAHAQPVSATATCTVPQVVGDPVNSAVQDVEDAGLVAVTRLNGGGSGPYIYVRSQSPAGGRKVQCGSRVTLTVVAGQLP